jgi:hypothetical protein
MEHIDPRRTFIGIGLTLALCSPAFGHGRYSPDALQIKRGETIRFVMHNKGTTSMKS